MLVDFFEDRVGRRGDGGGDGEGGGGLGGGGIMEEEEEEEEEVMGIMAEGIMVVVVGGDMGDVVEMDVVGVVQEVVQEVVVLEVEVEVEVAQGE